MSIKLALAGDTMVGPGVAAALQQRSHQAFFSPAVVEAVREADLCILNLECCISDRGEPWGATGKPFFFRAPPRAVEILNHLGVDCVNLANNHSLDFGYTALSDTFEHLSAAGIQWVGAGPDLARARAPMTLESGGFKLSVVGVADHPADFGATPDRPGTAYADLKGSGVPNWLEQALRDAKRAGDAVLLTPHWGSNFTSRPAPHVRSAASMLGRLATLVAGHSAHVVHGVERNVIYDMGDFLETYPGERASGSVAVRGLRRAARELKRVGKEIVSKLRTPKPLPGRGQSRGESFLQRQRRHARLLYLEAQAARLRDDLGLLFLVTLDQTGPKRLEALPLKLSHCHTTLAQGRDAAWVRRRFRGASQAYGTTVIDEGDRMVITWT